MTFSSAAGVVRLMAMTAPVGGFTSSVKAVLVFSASAASRIRKRLP